MKSALRCRRKEDFTCEIIPFRELYFIPHVAGQSFIRLSGYMIFIKKPSPEPISPPPKDINYKRNKYIFPIIHSSTL